MSQEVEVTVLDINKNELENKLISLGAEKIQDTRLTVDWFRIKGTEEGTDPWFLRIRINSEGKNEVTWKAKSSVDGVVRKHKEINFSVNDTSKIADLFEELDLEKYAHQEKDRVSYKYKDWQFDIDTYPNMPPYVEIEGIDNEHVKEALKMLELENNRTWNQGERILIQSVYGLNWYEMGFDGLGRQ